MNALDKMSKKGVSLSLETVVIAIIILVVLAAVLFFIIKYGGNLGTMFSQQAGQSSALLSNVSAAIAP